VALDLDRINQLAAEPDDTIPEMTAEQAAAVVTILGSSPSRRRRR
jgi:hypothetical protein